MSTPATPPLSPDELKEYLSRFIEVAESTAFNIEAKLPEKILNEFPSLRKRTLPQLIYFAQGLLLEVCRSFDDGEAAFKFLKMLSPSALVEVFYFARMPGDMHDQAINSLGALLGPKVLSLSSFSGDNSRHDSLFQAMAESRAQIEGKPISYEPASLFVDGKPLHFGMFNHLHEDAGKRWFVDQLQQLDSRPGLEPELGAKIRQILEIDPSAQLAITKILTEFQLKVHHDATPSLRNILGQKSLSPSECSRRLESLIDGLGQESEAIDSSYCAKAIADCPSYREHALVTDLISALQINSERALRASDDKPRFEAGRLAAFDKLLVSAKLTQPEIDRVACLGILKMSAGDYLELRESGPDQAIIKMLEHHCGEESWPKNETYRNKVFLLGLLKHSNHKLLKQAAALCEEYATSLYSITGKPDFLELVASGAKRDVIFSGDLGL